MGSILSMILSNKQNRKLGKLRQSKFEKRQRSLSSSKEKQQGYQFKEPDEKEVQALRERFRREDVRNRVRLWAVTLATAIILLYLFWGMF